MLGLFKYNLKFFASKVSNASNYKILKGEYLVPLPPKRSMSSYAIFVKDYYRQLKSEGLNKSIDVSEKASQLSQKWQNLDDNQKKKFENKANSLRAKYYIEMEEYKKKFVDPFIRVSTSILIQRKAAEQYKKTKKESEDGDRTSTGGLSEYRKAKDQFAEKLTQEDRKKLEQQVAAKKAENEKIISQYRIPTLPYTSMGNMLRGLRSKALNKGQNIPNVNDLSTEMKLKYDEMYKEMVEKYHKEMNEFTEKFGITPDELNKMLKKEERNEDGSKIKVKGIQTMTVSAEKKEIRKAFEEKVKQIRKEKMIELSKIDPQGTKKEIKRKKKEQKQRQEAAKEKKREDSD